MASRDALLLFSIRLKDTAQTYRFQVTSQGESSQVRPTRGIVEAKSQSLQHLGHAMKSTVLSIADASNGQTLRTLTSPGSNNFPQYK